jgi:hypothetical protein
MAQGLSGMILADKGLICASLKERLKQAGCDLQTPLRNNMKDTRNPDFVRWIISKRRLVETVIGQLTERFRINAIRAKDMWHFKAKVARKILAHAIATFIAKQTGNMPAKISAINS